LIKQNKEKNKSTIEEKLEETNKFERVNSVLSLIEIESEQGTVVTNYNVISKFEKEKDEKGKDGSILDIGEYKEVNLQIEDDDMIRVSQTEEESPWEVIAIEKNVEVKNNEEKYSIMSDYFN